MAQYICVFVSLQHIQHICVFVCRLCIGHNCTVEEKLEFKRGEDVLQGLKSFVIWVIWLVVIVEHETVSAKIEEVEEVLGAKLYVGWEARFIFEASGEILSVLC